MSAPTTQSAPILPTFIYPPPMLPHTPDAVLPICAQEHSCHVTLDQAQLEHDQQQRPRHFSLPIHPGIVYKFTRADGQFFLGRITHIAAWQRTRVIAHVEHYRSPARFSLAVPYALYQPTSWLGGLVLRQPWLEHLILQYAWFLYDTDDDLYGASIDASHTFYEVSEDVQSMYDPVRQ